MTNTHNAASMPQWLATAIGVFALIGFLCAVYMVSAWPWWGHMDRHDYCVGYVVGYRVGYCSHENPCHTGRIECPQNRSKYVWWDSSFMAGAKDGHADGFRAAGFDP